MLMAETSGVFTLTNYGQARNCTLTTLLFPANFAIARASIGDNAVS